MSARPQWVELQHDGFGRRTLLRRLSLVHGQNRTCKWCGSKRTRRIARFRPLRLFQYVWISDASTQAPDWPRADDQEFCSIDCWRTYNYEGW